MSNYMNIAFFNIHYIDGHRKNWLVWRWCSKMWFINDGLLNERSFRSAKWNIFGKMYKMVPSIVFFSQQRRMHSLYIFNVQSFNQFVCHSTMFGKAEYTPIPADLLPRANIPTVNKLCLSRLIFSLVFPVSDSYSVYTVCKHFQKWRKKIIRRHILNVFCAREHFVTVFFQELCL